MLHFPHLAKTSLPNDVEIVEKTFLNLYNLDCFRCNFNLRGFFKKLAAIRRGILGLPFLSLKGEMFGLFKFILVLLGISHVIIADFLIDAIDVEIG
jgi:hypothetical protein